MNPLYSTVASVIGNFGQSARFRPASALGVILVALPVSSLAQELDLSPRLLYEIRGEEKADTSFSLSGSVGDVNRDGFEDFLVLSSHRPRNEKQEFNYARVHDGLTGVALYDLSRRLARLGLARLGDLDGDAVPDFGVADSSRDTFTVFSCASGTVLRSHRATDVGRDLGPKEVAVHQFAASVGDLDADGVSDYSRIVDVYTNEDRFVFFTGAYSQIYSGATGDVLLRLEDQEKNEFVLWKHGGIMGGVGDVNKDAVPDFACGSSTDRNLIRIISGTLRGSLTFDSVPDQYILAEYQAPRDEAIKNIRVFEDLDSDGHPELLGSVSLDPISDWARGVVVAISPLPDANNRLQELWRSPPSDGYGTSPSYARLIGDVDGDGFPEFVTQNQKSDGGSSSLHLWSSSDGRTVYHMPPPEDSSGFFAHPLAVVGDLDGDGIHEVAVNDSPWNNGIGRVQVYSLGPGASRPPDPSVRTDGNALTVSWPPIFPGAVLEISEDLANWREPSQFLDPENHRYVLPHTERPRQRYFRLRYQAEAE